MKLQIFEQTPELTRVSSKGQLVIPQDIRKKLDIKEGNTFAVTSKDDLVILKKIKNPILKEELRILNEVEEAWKEIEKGECIKTTKEDFLKELEEW